MRSPFCEAVAWIERRDHGLIDPTNGRRAHATLSRVRHHFAQHCKSSAVESAGLRHVCFHIDTYATVRHVRQGSIGKRREAAVVMDFTMSRGLTSGQRTFNHLHRG